MEKRLYTAPEMILCTCGNQLLVLPGCTCDLCMGVVAESADLQSATATERRERFDLSYFEALERMFESFEFAA